MNTINFVENVLGRKLSCYEEAMVEIMENVDKDYIYIPCFGRSGWTRYAKVKYSTIGKRPDMVILDEGMLKGEDE